MLSCQDANCVPKVLPQSPFINRNTKRCQLWKGFQYVITYLFYSVSHFLRYNFMGMIICLIILVLNIFLTNFCKILSRKNYLSIVFQTIIMFTMLYKDRISWAPHDHLHDFILSRISYPYQISVQFISGKTSYLQVSKYFQPCNFRK